MFVSDTHGKHVYLSNRIPPKSSIDIMIYCGDVTLSYGYSKKDTYINNNSKYGMTLIHGVVV